jgi:rare lipoprotein A (peptidoglycan hydrolase)
MGRRAALAIYRGTRTATLQNLRLLGYIERCQRNPKDQGRVRTYDRQQRATAKLRRHPPMSYAVASWYDDSVGQTASGYHAGYGVANKYMAFGTRVLFAYHGRTVVAIVDDRGPYVGGRDWDLNQNTAGALGFDGVDTVGYHIEVSR